ncbi:hypothetical protein HED60_24200 [Planctomycetales bacterium ZRK34]|nr:hypothetical protein HED60_24200 [Planctomycetales bacterium ZRK34]
MTTCSNCKCQTNCITQLSLVTLILLGIGVALCPLVTGRDANSAGYFMMLGLLLFPVSMMCRSVVLMFVGVVLILFGLPALF